MRKKKIFIIIILVLSGVLILSALYLISKGRKQTSKTNETTKIQAPDIPNYINGTIPLSVSFSEKDFLFPDKLPLLFQKKNTMSEDQIRKISSNLGFDSEPITTTDAKSGTIYIWSNDKNFLFITPKLNKIKFGPSQSSHNIINNSLNKQLTDKTMESIAMDFLEKIDIEKVNLKLSNITYLKVDPTKELFTLTTKNDATIYQLNYSYSESKYPILTLNPQDTIIYVQLLQDGTVLNSEATVNTTYINGSSEYKIMSYKELYDSINQSILVSLDNSNINLPDLQKDAIKQITISSVEIAYLLDKPSNEYLQPVFLLKGIANIADYEQGINTSLYLPALAISN